MPNYEIVRKTCSLKKKTVLLPATYVSEPNGSNKLIPHINDCLSKDSSCTSVGCKFCAGDTNPFTEV
ncbi:MAG: hypothetical protein ACM3OC_00710 [Deltaproteobacteria bacterium]